MVFIHRDRFDLMPRTTFYITAIFELRGDTEKYVYSMEWVLSSWLICSFSAAS
jgi:hypothetical protein